MLLEKEILVGDLYAWDILHTEPEIGCNLFKIIEDSKEEYGRLVVLSPDGCMLICCGKHCLIPAARALRRLEVLEQITPPKEGTHERWKYDRELEYLKAFEAAYWDYIKNARKNKNEEMTNKIKQYFIGMDVDIEDIIPKYNILISDIIDLMFRTDGVDDKIYLTITSLDDGESIFYGRNAELRTMPADLANTVVAAIDDCGKCGSMNLLIHTAKSES